eukprot:3706024-Amphidinium_carterae.2
MNLHEEMRHPSLASSGKVVVPVRNVASLKVPLHPGDKVEAYRQVAGRLGERTRDGCQENKLQKRIENRGASDLLLTRRLSARFEGGVGRVRVYSNSANELADAASCQSVTSLGPCLGAHGLSVLHWAAMTSKTAKNSDLGAIGLQTAFSLQALHGVNLEWPEQQGRPLGLQVYPTLTSSSSGAMLGVVCSGALYDCPQSEPAVVFCSQQKHLVASPLCGWELAEAELEDRLRRNFEPHGRCACVKSAWPTISD